jgi:hypothetical protein
VVLDHPPIQQTDARQFDARWFQIAKRGRVFRQARIRKVLDAPRRRGKAESLVISPSDHAAIMRATAGYTACRRRESSAPQTRAKRKPRSTGAAVGRGSAWGMRLVGAAQGLWRAGRKARMTELHDIHVIHRTVSTGNLKVTEGAGPGSGPVCLWQDHWLEPGRFRRTFA